MKKLLLLTLLSVVAIAAYAMTPQEIAQGVAQAVDKMPNMVRVDDQIDRLGLRNFLLILSSGALIAVPLTILKVLRIRRENRSQKKPKIPGDQLESITKRWGAIYGIFFTVCFQGMVSEITGLPMLWESLLLAWFATGPVAMAVYDVTLVGTFAASRMEWKWSIPAKVLYEWLKVRNTHGLEKGETDSDLTRVVMLEEDITQPGDK